MAKRDYICCDNCDCKLIYDGYDVARDSFDDAKPPLLLCGDCGAANRDLIARLRDALQAAVEAVRYADSYIAVLRVAYPHACIEYKKFRDLIDVALSKI
jgi:hypothetical protein